MKKLLIVVLVIICFPACELLNVSPCTGDTNEAVYTIVELDITTGQTRKIIDEWFDYSQDIIGVNDSLLYLSNEFLHNTIVDISNKKVDKDWRSVFASPSKHIYLENYNKFVFGYDSTLYSYDFSTRQYDTLATIKNHRIVSRSLVKISHDEIGFGAILRKDSLGEVYHEERVYTYSVISNKIELFANIASFDFDISQDKSTIVWGDWRGVLNILVNGQNRELLGGINPILFDNDKKIFFYVNPNSIIYNLTSDEITLLDFSNRYSDVFINKLNNKIYGKNGNLVIVNDLQSTISDTLLNINELPISTGRAVTSESLSIHSIRMSEDETKMYIVIRARLYWDGC